MISIHALLAESDTLHAMFFVIFLISIHALLAESDRKLPMREPTAFHFYPRSPCGERQRPAAKNGSARRFLSTLSLRRATHQSLNLPSRPIISIHALLAESDMFTGILPHHGRISIHALLAESDLKLLAKWFCNSLISIHALLAESD